MDSAQGKRILIVDDANLVRQYYADALKRAGFEVGEAANGLEALERLVMVPADLLIIDVNMPKMDGITCLKALRRHDPGIASTPALVISTANAAADFEQAYAAGANFYLVKPVTQDDLVAYAAMLCGVPA
jgi:two-component system chemotaxis response regulator CheY